MATSEQLEREAEATRAQIAATLDELRSRLTPGQVVDQLVSYARDSGGGDFVRNLGQQVVDNPLPVTLMGAGLAWLMMAGRRSASDAAGGDRRGFGSGQDLSRAGAMAGERASAGVESLGDLAQATRNSASATASDLTDGARRQARDWADGARARAERLNQQLGESGASLQESANAAGAAMRDAASDAYGAASNAYDAAAERSRQGADAVSRGARSMRESAAASSRNVMEYLQEQPLVLAGIGLAVGAMLGTSLPSTEMEDNLMGDVSDATKQDAKAFAEEQVDKGKAVAEQAMNGAKPEIEQQLRHGAPYSSSGGEGRAQHKPDDGATLVPSDEANQDEMATDAARRDAKSSST
ncbi:MAG TPA: DUF3618 domain-containing protein [Xanthobacteraceae bacterium]|jgi:ElaB/YqjD/DUF883 family membrane-anchored ribosome-binding protein